jgi:hypothetical protein
MVSRLLFSDLLQIVVNGASDQLRARPQTGCGFSAGDGATKVRTSATLPAERRELSKSNAPR